MITKITTPYSLMKKFPIPRFIPFLLILTTTAPAQFQPIEILLDETTLGESVEAGKSVTAEGVTMTITNVLATDGGSSAAVEDWGILFGTDPLYDDVESLGISFNVDVKITSYMIGSREDVPAGMHFTVTGPNGTSGQNPVPPFSGFTEQEITLPFVEGGLQVLKAGQTYTITHNLGSATMEDPIFHLESLFVTPVDLSIKTVSNMIHIEYVGILQEWSQLNGWQDMDPQPPNIWQFIPDSPSRLFRAKHIDAPTNEGMALIPAGSFTMGRTSGDTDSNAPPVTVNVSEFYMAKHEVTKALWDKVRTWGLANGYTDLAAGAGKAANHPVQSISWFDVVKWCNARSEKEGLTPVYTVSGAVMKTGTNAPEANWSANGYRLPTEAEWEKAARGGVSGKRFPSGDTISHGQANYYSLDGYSYDVSPTQYYHPTYATGSFPFTSPVGSFAANGYGLYDMQGNVFQWCWDWYGASSYVDGATDPRGSESGSDRVIRGGSWASNASICRAAHRSEFSPLSSLYLVGFRFARSSIE
jgi:formylglycine-generating enzyme